MKILFIGNSYTYYNDMPKILESIANGNGHDLETHQVTKGGWYLHKYLDVENEYQDKLMQLIQENRYDVCFMQEQSLCPVLDYERFADGAKRLQQLLQPVAKELVLYQTWPRKEGSPQLEEHNLTVASMGEDLIRAYERLGKELGIRVSPVGKQFIKMLSVGPDADLYKEDKSHPSYAGSCLAALQHYKTVFGTLPENTSMLQLPKETVELMCRLIAED